ncbi:MAG: hypothetical protein K0Q72_4635, partial [Armatimonadetes bacterium]|nr:hypothetical protein [Armatimonadota bacterium]
MNCEVPDLGRLGSVMIAALIGAALCGPVHAKQPASAARAKTLAWKDVSGRAYGTADLRGAGATVFVFGSLTCPCADRYNGRVGKLARELEPLGARFFQVFSAPDATPAAVTRYAAGRGIRLPLVADRSGALAKRLRAQATPTAVVLDRSGAVRYRGRIDDNPDPQAVVREDLRVALAAVLQGEPVMLAETRVVGCTIAPGASQPAARPRLATGLGTVVFPVTTRSPRAQQFFNQGMNRWFGFNFPEAEASFREAARLDPRCAMARWGIALSLGMNYNMDFNPARLGEAEAAAQEAVKLSAAASRRERLLIRALAVRHAPGKEMMTQLGAYQAEMARVYAEFPADASIGVLYAASGMDLHPWELWNKDGTPAPGTLEIERVLEDVLRRDPNHIGANHYYIHATEASPTPERALPSTGRLAAAAPSSGHLVHMPSHTFLRLGDYRGSVQANRTAAALDSAYFTGTGKATGYAGYYAHNLDFIVASLMFEGRGKEAVEASRELSRESAKWAPEMAPLMCGGGSGLMTV